MSEIKLPTKTEYRKLLWGKAKSIGTGKLWSVVAANVITILATVLLKYWIPDWWIVIAVALVTVLLTWAGIIIHSIADAPYELHCDQVRALANLTAVKRLSDVTQLHWKTISALNNVVELEALAACQDGTPADTSENVIKIIVSDGADDGGPSSTATIYPASDPHGIALGGTGTGTFAMKTVQGRVRFAVHEPSAGSKRHLWCVMNGLTFEKAISFSDN